MIPRNKDKVKIVCHISQSLLDSNFKHNSYLHKIVNRILSLKYLNGVLFDFYSNIKEKIIKISKYDSSDCNAKCTVRDFLPCEYSLILEFIGANISHHTAFILDYHVNYNYLYNQSISSYINEKDFELDPFHYLIRKDFNVNIYTFISNMMFKISSLYEYNKMIKLTFLSLNMEIIHTSDMDIVSNVVFTYMFNKDTMFEKKY